MDKVLMDPHLNPEVKRIALQLQDLMLKKHGVKILFTQGFRTKEYQNELYAKGRTKPGRVVTGVKGGYSYHNYGLAVDFVPLINGKCAWNRNDLFMLVGQEAQKLGFTWGGSWKKFVDKPHLEKNFGLTIQTLFSGKRPEVK